MLSQKSTIFLLFWFREISLCHSFDLHFSWMFWIQTSITRVWCLMAKYLRWIFFIKAMRKRFQWTNLILLIFGEHVKGCYCVYYSYVGPFFNLSQDDEVVPSTDIKGVWAPDIDRSFQEDGDIYYPFERRKSLYLHLKQISC